MPDSESAQKTVLYIETTLLSTFGPKNCWKCYRSFILFKIDARNSLESNQEKTHRNKTKNKALIKSKNFTLGAI